MRHAHLYAALHESKRDLSHTKQQPPNDSHAHFGIAGGCDGCLKAAGI